MIRAGRGGGEAPSWWVVGSRVLGGSRRRDWLAVGGSRVEAGGGGADGGAAGVESACTATHQPPWRPAREQTNTRTRLPVSAERARARAPRLAAPESTTPRARNCSSTTSQAKRDHDDVTILLSSGCTSR